MADPLGSTTITAVTPGSLMQGEGGSVRIDGNKTHFDATSTVSFSSAGIAASGVTVTSGTLLTATLTIDLATPVGPSNVTVTTGSEVATGSAKFTVEAAPPVTIHVSPASEMRGIVTAVDINGADTHFGAASVVSFAGAGITVSDLTVFSETTIRVTITISPNADLGTSAVTVTTGSEHAVGGLFTVELNPALVKISSVSPNALPQGAASVAVQVNGQHTNFDDTSVVSFAGAGIEILAYSLVSPTAMQATISIDPLAPLGSSDVTVTTAGVATAGVDVFTVQQNPAGPQIASVSPASGAQGDSFRVEVAGLNTHFDETSAVAFSGEGLAASDLSVASATTLRVTLTIAEGAASGASDVTVTTGSEVAIGPGAFAVIASTEKAVVLREAVNTYLRLTHVTDPAAVAICEQFVAGINQALRGQVDGSSSGVMVTISSLPPAPAAPPPPPGEEHHSQRNHGRYGRKKP